MYAPVDVADLRNKVARHAFEPPVLNVGPAVAFSSHGLLLPCIAGEDGFHRLRACLLGPECAPDRRPHITLAHPRNPKAAGDRLAHALRLPERIEIVFSSVALIEQEDAARPWQIVETHESRA